MGLKRNARIADLYKKFVAGAEIHTRAVEYFARKPSMPLKAIFQNAIKGSELSRSQKRFLFNSLKSLKINYALVERIDKEVSAEDLLGTAFNALGLRPERQESMALSDSLIRKLLDESRGKSGLVVVSRNNLPQSHEKRRDAFGIVLTVEPSTFNRISKRIVEIGFASQAPDAFSAPLTRTDPATGRIDEVLFTIIPKNPAHGSLDEVNVFEQVHRENWALGISRRSTAASARKKSFDQLMMRLKSEIVASARTGQVQSLEGFLEHIVEPAIPLIKSEIKGAEFIKILASVDFFIGHHKKFRSEQLMGIARTTPLPLLKRRLEGVLKHST